MRSETIGLQPPGIEIVSETIWLSGCFEPKITGTILAVRRRYHSTSIIRASRFRDDIDHTT